MHISSPSARFGRWPVTSLHNQVIATSCDIARKLFALISSRFGVYATKRPQLDTIYLLTISNGKEHALKLIVTGSIKKDMIHKFKYKYKLLGSSKHQTYTIISSTNNNIAFQAKSSTQNRTLVSFVFADKSARTSVPCTECLVGRPRDQQIAFRRGMGEERCHSVLVKEMTVLSSVKNCWL